MDYDAQSMYLGSPGWSFGNGGMIWGSAGSGKSNIAMMYFSKLRGQWQVQEKKKDCDSPFKKA